MGGFLNENSITSSIRSKISRGILDRLIAVREEAINIVFFKLGTSITPPIILSRNFLTKEIFETNSLIIYPKLKKSSG